MRLPIRSHHLFCWASVFTPTLAGFGCFLAPSMSGIPAQILAYAVQNVTCPVNVGYTTLLDENDIASIISTSQVIVATLDATTTYLNKSAQIPTSADTDLWRGPMLGVPFEYSQYIGQLLAHRTAIEKDQNLLSALPAGLTQQKDAAMTFFDTVVAKVDASQQTQIKNLLTPILTELSCAIRVFQPDSSVTTCRPATASGAATSMPVSHTATSTPTPSSSASTPSGAGAIARPTNAIVGSFLFVYGAFPLIWN